MKVQITDKDIRLMSEQVAYRLIKEWNDYDREEAIRNLELKTTILYNPLTKKHILYNQPIRFNYNTPTAQVYQDMVQYASKLGDGPIFEVHFDVTDWEESDDSFNYEIGMDSGTEERYSYSPAELEFSYAEFCFELKNGQMSKTGEYEELDLTPEDEEHLTNVANEDVNSFQVG